MRLPKSIPMATPCPDCLGKRVHFDYGNGIIDDPIAVRYRKCWAMGPLSKDEKTALMAWEKRPVPKEKP
jgi:hypothetical protein